jgi:hypothetical protein
VDGRSGTWWTHFSSRQGGLLLLLVLWTLWAMRSIVHKSTGFVIAIVEVDGADEMGAKVDGEDPVLAGRAQGDQLAAQALADAPVAVPETDEAVAADFADLIVGGVFDRRQNLGERPRARPIPLRRGRHAERFMRPLMVVQRGSRTPTGPCYARSFIGIILGSGSEFTFMGPSLRLMTSFFAARWMGREQIVGWNFRHGCSTGRLALTTSF